MLYRPYPELKGRWIEPARRFSLSTPWITVEAECGGQLADAVGVLLAHLDDVARGDANAEVPHAAQAALANFAAYPMVYLEPGTKGEALASCAESAGDEPSAAPLFAAIADGARRLGAPESITREIAARGATHAWQWPVAEALSRSARAGGETFDAVAAFTHARRLARCCQLDKNEPRVLRDVVTAVAARGEAEHRRLIATLVRQSHFITSRCEAAVTPALSVLPQLADDVARFLVEERGHDALMEKALKAFGIASPGVLPLLPAYAAMMGALIEAASGSALGFALALDTFEGVDVTTDQSSYAKLVAEAPGGAQAAVWIDQHHKINRAGGHGAFGFGLAQKIAPLSAAELVAALRLSESLHLSRSWAAGDLFRSAEAPHRGLARGA